MRPVEHRVNKKYLIQAQHLAQSVDDGHALHARTDHGQTARVFPRSLGCGECCKSRGPVTVSSLPGMTAEG